jgi:GNAT superfamily N-acetyltransferase
MDIRPAQDSDLSLLAGIEDESDALFAVVFVGWSPGASPTGAERAAEPGILLVAGDPPVGFAQLLDLEGRAHLEQISVVPEHGRQGVGAALLEEVCRLAAARGYREVTLRTFADLPWNAAFYARHGFVELADEPEWMQPLREAEERSGLTAHGRRVAMRRIL